VIDDPFTGRGPDEAESSILAHDQGSPVQAADTESVAAEPGEAESVATEPVETEPTEVEYVGTELDEVAALAGESGPGAPGTALATLPRRSGARPLPRPRGRITSRRTAWWIGAVLLLCFVYFSPKADWNQDARVDMSVTLVDHRTFAIDQYQLNTGDKDFFHGHYYALKSPGTGFLGAPIYLLYKASFAVRGQSVFFSPPDDPQLRFLEAFVMITIPSVLFLMLFFWFLGFFSRSLVNRALLTLATGLATTIFAYSDNIFAHVLVADLLFGAFVILYVLATPEAVIGSWTRRLVRHPELSAMAVGLALGGVILLEYPPAVIALLLGVYALLYIPRRLVGYIVVGSAPPLMMLLAYNYAVYRNPFTLGYTSGGTNLFASHLYAAGTGGFQGHPIPAALWGMSFSPFRGLFFLSPFLLLAFPGFWMWWKRGRSPELLLFLLISGGFFLFISCFATWNGGYAVGPRYLIPMLLFMAFPIIFVFDWISTLPGRDVVRYLVYLSIGLSVLAVWAETIALNSWPDDQNLNPLFAYSLPEVVNGLIFPNFGITTLGMAGLASLWPLVIGLALLSGVFVLPLWRGSSLEGRARRVVGSLQAMKVTPRGRPDVSSQETSADGV
jgi:hypothetical protein